MHFIVLTRKKKEIRKNLDDNVKDTLRSTDKERLKDSRQKKDVEKSEAFNYVQGMSMVDRSILHTQAYKIIQKVFEDAINEGPTYTCDICIKSEFRKSVIKLNPSKYEKGTFDKLASRV